jgi:twitching motility protein PilT
MIEVMRDLLAIARDSGASDLHVTVGCCPKMRLHGELTDIEKYPVMTPEDTKSILYSILSEFQVSYLENMGELDFAYEDESGTRFRANVFKQKGNIAGVFRVLPSKILTIEELGLPPVTRSFSALKKGLVLVTGPTGSGKSTTLAAIINQVNRMRRDHIITIEDPIEYVHHHQKCVVNQREVGTDTLSFENALRGSLREDPDVILVGEMRDNETISVALTAAETGHLVFSTLHTIGAASTINRIIDSFPPHARQQVRTQLAMVLEGVVTQRLVPKKEGGRLAALEILVMNDAIRNMIREDKTHQIDSTMQTSSSAGMQTLDFHLAQLVKDEKITMQTAVNNCINIDNFKRYMSSGGTLGAPGSN